MEARRLADLHAYVDDCLDPDERRAFEKQMAEEPALARRAAMWRAQSVAIRSAFDGEGTRAFSISIARPQNESAGKGRGPAAAGPRPLREPAARGSPTSVSGASRPGATLFFRPKPNWRPGLAALCVCLFCLWSPSARVVSVPGLAEAGVSAFRAFAHSGLGPVELATDDPAESQKWLTSHLLRPIHLSATPAALSLIGARVVPSPGAASAFLVYKSAQGLIGLMVQPLDAPSARMPELIPVGGRYAALWTSGGQGFVLVGDLEAASLLRIAGDFYGLAAGAVQATPDRGS